MRLERHRGKIRAQLDQERAQRGDQMNHGGMVICDPEHMRMVQELREYLRQARNKCLDWKEESREFFASHPEYEEDEAFMNQVAQEIEDDSVSGLSEAHRVRDSSPVSVAKDPKEKESQSVPRCPQANTDAQGVLGDLPILESLDLQIETISAANAKSLRLLRDFIPN